MAQAEEADRKSPAKPERMTQVIRTELFELFILKFLNDLVPFGK